MSTYPYFHNFNRPNSILFLPNTNVSVLSMGVPFTIPPTATLITIMGMGAGGGGGCPALRNTITANAGGGGGASGVGFKGIFLAAELPPVVYVVVSVGGIGGATANTAGGTGGGCGVVISPGQPANGDVIIWGVGGGGGGVSSAGAVGAATDAFGNWLAIGGGTTAGKNGYMVAQAGSAGSSGAQGNTVTPLSATGLYSTGGSAGGGGATATNGRNGGIIAAVTGWFPQRDGGAGASTATGDGSRGQDGISFIGGTTFLKNNFISTGGTGGGSCGHTSGNGGAGGKGGPGGGGGGGGSGTTGQASGAGGNGGDGWVYITWV